MPCPYARLIVGTRHCRVLVGNINSDATGFCVILHSGELNRNFDRTFRENNRHHNTYFFWLTTDTGL